MRILFTGGSGKAGKHVIPELLALVLNVDLDTAQDKILHTLHRDAALALSYLGVRFRVVLSLS